MEKIYTETARIRYRDCDRHGDVKLNSWFDYLQEAAANHANALGIGYDQITALARIWVLSRLKLEIFNYAPVGSELEIRTYPTPFRRIFAERQFQILHGGSEIARASSQWLFLNSGTMRPVRLSELPVRMPDNSDLPVFYQFDSRPQPPDAADGGTMPTVLIRPTMEDVNAHLNNAEYAGIVQDCLSPLHPAPFRFKSVELGWHLAVRAGETLRVRGELAERGAFRAAGFTAAGALSFSASGIITG